MAFFKNIEGSYGIFSYIIDYENWDGRKYFVECDSSLLELAKSNVHEFILSNTPKFGKFEVEEFIGSMICHCLIAKEITALMNMYISYDDSPYNCGKYSKENVKEQIMGFCEIFSQDENTVKLKYLGHKR